MTTLAIGLGLAFVVAVLFALSYHDECAYLQLEADRLTRERDNAQRRADILSADITAHLATTDRLYAHMVGLEARRFAITTRWWKRSQHRRLSAWQIAQKGARQ